MKFADRSSFQFCFRIFTIFTLNHHFFALTFAETISGEIFAFFDANYDRYTDLLVRQGKNGLAVYLASTDDSSFREHKEFSVTFPWAKETIVNVGVADFNGDSFPDLLVTSVVDEKMNLAVCWGNLANFNNCKRSNDEEWLNVGSQPVIMNCNDDQINDFFVVLSNDSRVCFLGSTTVVESNFTSMDIFVQGKNNEAKLFSNAAHGFVDLTGDLNADVVLLVEPKDSQDGLPSFEFWEKTEKNLWSLSRFKIPDPVYVQMHPKLLPDASKKFVGHIVFDDFNRDGRTDILLPFCYGENCSKLTLMLCWSKDDKTWSWTPIEVPLNQTLNDQWSMAGVGQSGSSSFVVRSGDYTQNGYPDLLVVLTDKSKTSKAFFVENIPCKGNCDYGRQFQMSWQPVAPCQSVRAAAYFDLNEDGTLDVLYECEEKSAANAADATTISFSPSAYSGDTTFLKVEVYTATCGSSCANGKEGTGISLPGASLWYRMADTEGNEISSIYTQQSCTSHKSLLLPYALFGLGRSPNFVEQLRVGIPSSPPANQTWQQIVPNSRMYVIPVPSDAPGHWIGRLYITPSRLILASVAALGGVCTLLIIAIVILHYCEVKADRKERELQRKQFHFDAM